MIVSWYRRLVNRRANSCSRQEKQRPRAARQRFYRLPEVEQLEDRLAPAVDIWTGANGANFNNPGNWASGTVPVAGDDLVFTPGGVGGTILTNDLPGGTNFNSMTFYGPGGAPNFSAPGGTISVGWSIGGNTFGISSFITTTSTTTQTDITASMILNGNVTITSANVVPPFGGFQQWGYPNYPQNVPGSLVISGNIDMQSSHLTFDGAGVTEVTGVIAGTAATGVTKNGVGTVQFTQSNTFLGGVVINNGIMDMTVNLGWGSTPSVTVNNGGTWSVGPNGYSSNLTVNLTGNGYDGLGALFKGRDNNTQFDGSTKWILNGSNVTINAGTYESQGIRMDGVISGGAGTTFTKIGQGSLNLFGASTYAGPTVIDGGIWNFYQNGSALNSSSWTVTNQGILTIWENGFSSSVAHLGASAPINLNGGQFAFGSPTSGNGSQTLGNLVLGANTDDFVYVDDPNSANTSTVTFNQLVSGANSHVYFFGYGYGGVGGGGDIGRSNQIKFATAPALVNNILPNATTMGNNYVTEEATYSGANGVIPLSLGAGYTAGQNTQAVNGNTISGAISQSLFLNGSGTVTATGPVTIGSAGQTANLTTWTNPNGNGNGASMTLNLGANSLTFQGNTPFINTSSSDQGYWNNPWVGQFIPNDEGNAVTYITGQVISANGLTKTGIYGTLVLGSLAANVGADPIANNITGTVDVESGELLLAKTAGTAALSASQLTIGDNWGRCCNTYQPIGNFGSNESIVRFANSNQLPAAINVTVNSDGQFDVDSNTQTINNLSLTGGLEDAFVGVSGGGTLTVNGNINVANLDTDPLDAGGDYSRAFPQEWNPDWGLANILGVTRAGSEGVVVSSSRNGNGNFVLSNAVHTFTVTNTGKEYEIEFFLPVTSASGSVMLTGGGTVGLFNNNNNIGGGVTVTNGQLSVIGGLTGNVAVNAATGILSGTSIATYGYSGTITGNVTATAGGTVTPGRPNFPIDPSLNKGILTVTGNADFSGGGNLLLRFSGTNQIGFDEDRFVVGGTLTLGGTSTLTVDLTGFSQAAVIGAAAPTAGIAYGSLSGTSFSNMTPTGVAGQYLLNAASVTNNPSGFQVLVTFKGTFATITIAHPPTVPAGIAFATSNGTALSQPAPGAITGATSPDIGTTVTAVAGTYTGSAGGTLVLSSNGSFTYTPPSAQFTGADLFTLMAQTNLGATTTFTTTFNDTGAPPPAPPAPPAGGASPVGATGNTAALNAANNLLGASRYFATGVDAGQPPLVNVYDATTSRLLVTLLPFPVGFTGGVRVAVADVNGDGIPDIICGAGPGALPQVTIYDGRSFGAFASFYAFSLSSLTNGIFPNNSASVNTQAIGNSYTGGVFVAGGDLTGKGYADLVVGADKGGGPQVEVFDGRSGALVASFFAMTRTFTGGVRVAVGDITGSGKADIITAAGPSGGPQVTAYDLNLTIVASFYGMPPQFTGGVFVAAGDILGVGRAQILTSPGAGGGPQVTMWDFAAQRDIANFYAYGSGFTGGVRVATAGRSGNGVASLFTVPGVGGGPEVEIFTGPALNAVGAFFAYPANFNLGLFVG